MDHLSDIYIVGAGITGLSCAIALLESPDCQGRNIQMFDIDSAVGGRIRSRALPTGEIVELGAARFSPPLHPLLTAAFQQQQQPSAPYPFTAPARQSETQQQMKDTLRWLASKLPGQEKRSFLVFASQHLGEDQADGLVRALGYDALRLPNVSAAMAFDIIGNHPEIQGFVDRPQRQWCYAVQGLSGLLASWLKQLVDGGVRIHTQQRLAYLGRRHGRHQLRFINTRSGSACQHQSRHVVLALPPSVMGALDLGFPQRWSPYQYGSLPLFKAFLTYAHPWWLSLGLSDQMLIVDNPLRKLYFAGDRHLWFYTDSAYANIWRDALRHGDTHFLSAVRAHLAQALHLPSHLLPMPQAHRCQYWPHGVEFCLAAGVDHPPALEQAKSGVIAASDAYTAHCGWMEGGLISGAAAAKMLLAQRQNHQPPSALSPWQTAHLNRRPYEHS